MITSITGTRSEIRVVFEDRVIEIEGELTLTPAFYAIKRTMKNLTNPEDLSNEEKEKIAVEILEYNINQPLKIIFED